MKGRGGTVMDTNRLLSEMAEALRTARAELNSYPPSNMHIRHEIALHAHRALSRYDAYRREQEKADASES